MTTEEALLAAIMADRAADMPRLAYADWLEENGQAEWGEFIRLQIEIARWERQEAKDSMLHPLRELRRREQVLRYIGDVEQNWWPTFTGITFPEISRGFAPCVRASWPDWLAHHEVILKRQPIEKVTLTTRPSIVSTQVPWDRSVEFRLRDFPSRKFMIDDLGAVMDGGDHRIGEMADSAVVGLLKIVWSRIEFDLPPALRHIGTYRGREIYAGATIGTPYRDYRAAENL